MINYQSETNPNSQISADFLQDGEFLNTKKQIISDKHQKLFLAVFITILIGIICVSFFAFTKHVNSTLRTDVENQFLEVTKQSKNVLQTNFKDLVVSLQSTAKTVSIYNDFSGEKIKELMQSEAKRHNYIRMGITLPSGEYFSSDGVDQSFSKDKNFNSVMQGIPYISESYLSQKDKKQVILIAVPIIDGEKSVGVLSAVCDTASLSNAFSVSSFDSNCYSYVISDKGQVILRPQNPLSKNNVKNVFYTLETEYKNNITNLVSDINKRQSGVYTFIANQNEEKFAAYVPIEHLNNWYMLSIVSTQPVLKKSNYIISLTSLLLLIIVFVFLAIATYIYFMKRSSRKKFEYMAYTDIITGCKNWPKFVIDVEEILKKSKDKRYAYIYMNIENFKFINDINGFAFGNKLLLHISDTFEALLEPNEPHARINADRFACLMEYENDQHIIKKLELVNDKIQLFKAQNNMDFPLNAFFGIYKIKDKNLPVITMSDRALLAMQTLNSASDCNYGFYNSSIRQRALMEKELENDMQMALDNGNFLVFLQPKFSLTSNKIIGAEALVRWLHPQRGLLPPSEFIDLFEQNGFIKKLDYYMFDETCKLIRKWIDSGKEPIPVSVNISRAHLYNPNLSEELYCATLRYNVPPHLIEIELTETMDFDNLSILLGIVERLKRFDFMISIDDFGSGYSSLNLLKDLPVDILKIDREFLSEASDEKRGRKVIASIIDMARKLDMKTVAEGVENLEQADFLNSVNCDYVQGFYFSKPIAITEFEEKYIYNDNIKNNTEENDISADNIMEK